MSEHTRKKNQSRLSTVDPSKSSQSPSSKFIPSSLDLAFNMQNSNCALDEDSAGVTIVGSRTNLGVPALTNLLPQTSLNVATRSPELTQLAVADSKEKKFRAFSGDPAMGSCVLANDVAVERWQLLSSPNHSNILDVTKPQTNNESVCVRVKCSLTLSTCLSNELALQQNVRQDRKFQAQRDLQVAVLVQDASMRGAVVNRVCTRQNTRHGQ